MRNVKMTVEYDGTDFFGFQRQPHCRTVQRELESALREVLYEQVKTISAGRTDAGVHAVGQVVNFWTSNPIPIERLPYALNAVLPRDIAIRAAEEVGPAFHARISARSRCYRYGLVNCPHRSARLGRFFHFMAQPLCISAVQEAAASFEGEHDFRSFKGGGGEGGSTFRRVLRSRCLQMMEVIYFIVEANSFLYQMVRRMVALLISIGLGEYEPRIVPTVLSGETVLPNLKPAPPNGLCLLWVRY